MYLGEELSSEPSAPTRKVNVLINIKAVKIIAIILAVVVAFSAFAMMGYADNTSVNAYIAQYDDAENDADRVIDWYEVNGDVTFD